MRDTYVRSHIVLPSGDRALAQLHPKLCCRVVHPPCCEIYRVPTRLLLLLRSCTSSHLATHLLQGRLLLRLKRVRLLLLRLLLKWISLLLLVLHVRTAGG